MSKTSVLAKLTVKPGTRDQLIEAFAPMMAQVNDNEPGTEIYILHADAQDENVAWVYELYTDADAMGTHSGSDTMAGLFGALGDLIDGAPELIMLTPVTGKGL